MREVLLLALAGAAGTLTRYGLSGWTYRMLGERLPFGTLFVNLLGCLVIGFVMEAALATELLPRMTRFALTVGFLGAFTTFSTFGYETLRYLEDGAWWLATANVGLNVVLGVLAVWAGLMSANMLFGGVR